MIPRYFKYSLLLCVLTMVGCSNLASQSGGNQQVSATAPEATLTTVIPSTPVVEETISPDAGTETAATQTAEGTTLRIWVPPQFDPAGKNPASQLLKARLEQFEAENPGIDLDVRVKALDGTGGLLEGLSAANAAAPLTLPDLVLLPRTLLESAALKGLLYPYDGLSSLMDDPSWFEYARQLARLESNTYGIPFAGDAMLMAYYPAKIGDTPSSLEASISLGEVLLFPAADLQALFTLCMYLASGGSLQDSEGRPSLDRDTLVNILNIYQRASQAGVMPYWLTQYSKNEQVWEAFMGEGYPMAVTWSSTYLEQIINASANLSVAPLPTPDGTPFTLASGWSWALAGQDPERRMISVRLVEFLVERDFLASWTYAAGYLPPRVDALQGWQDTDLQQMLEQISYSAQLIPPADLIASIGPSVEQAVVDVLKAQSDPQSAAQTAIEQINQP
jgi:ABC-type glycerol-3-phosphate transport system substrate-binding protein